MYTEIYVGNIYFRCGELLREQLTNRQYKRLEYTVDGKKSVLVRQQGTPQSAQPLPSQTRHPLQPKQHAKPKPGKEVNWCTLCKDKTWC